MRKNSELGGRASSRVDTFSRPQKCIQIRVFAKLVAAAKLQRRNAHDKVEWEQVRSLEDTCEAGETGKRWVAAVTVETAPSLIPSLSELGCAGTQKFSAVAIAKRLARLRAASKQAKEAAAAAAAERKALHAAATAAKNARLAAERKARE